MLDVAHMGVHVCQMTGREEVNACYDMVTRNGAKTLHLEEKYGVEVGKPASLIVLDARDYYDAICTRNKPRYIISQGKIIAYTTRATTNLSFT